MKIAHELGLDKHGIGVKPTNFDDEPREDVSFLPRKKDETPDEQ